MPGTSHVVFLDLVDADCKGVQYMSATCKLFVGFSACTGFI